LHNAIKRRNKAGGLGSRLLLGNRAGHPGIDIDALFADQYENGSTTVIPKHTMQRKDGLCIERVKLLEIDQRRIFCTKDAIQFQQLEGAAQEMRLRRERGKLIFAQKETRRPTFVDAEFFRPVFGGCNAHLRRPFLRRRLSIGSNDSW
jgi:hypothetical protein